MNKKWWIFFGFALIFFSCKERKTLDISGVWQVKLQEVANRDTLFKPDRGLGPTQNVMYETTVLTDSAKREGEIRLPGTLDEGGFGNVVVEPFLGCLSRKYKFIGKAIFSREIKVPKTGDWRLSLERVLWKSSVKIDGVEIGSQESLATAHEFFIPNLEKGKHEIEITVDNTMIHRLGEKGHAYGEHMQTIWNGVLGEMTLTQVLPQDVENVRINAPFSREKFEISFLKPKEKGKFEIKIFDKKSGKKIETGALEEKEIGDEIFLSLKLDSAKIKAWSEFEPNLYKIELLNDGKKVFCQNIGFRSLKREGNKLFFNGEELFLRGNLDNCHFPLTGYPSMRKADWVRIFQISKENGCNNIRFHSYCPPRAAFEAADEVGLYLAPEAGVWIDGWMPGKVVGLGRGNEDLDNFVKAELNAIQRHYGAHASFTMIGIGNELGSSNFEAMKNWIADLKTEATRGFEQENGYSPRLYTTSTAREITAADDYFVTHHYPEVGGVRQWMFPRTNWNYETLYRQTALPTVAHEIGQWPIYPDWAEIEKYTGVLAPRNLQALKQHAEEKGVLQFSKEFNFASGHQNRLMYKDEIESFMRTPSCRGIHLLGIQDYSGQGEALVGFLDSFYENKGFFPASQVRGCFAPVVTLAGFEKYGWSNSEVFKAVLQVRNLAGEIKNAKILFEFFDNNNKKIAGGETPATPIKSGELKTLGVAALGLLGYENEKISLRTKLVGVDGETLSEENSWNFWVFEKPKPSPTSAAVVQTASLNEALAALQNGARVVLDASHLGAKDAFRKGDWGAVYWSTTWFPGQAMQSLGVWLDKNHPIFKPFKTEGYADWIFWKIFENSRVFILNDLGENFRPTAMAVPDFHNNELLGGVFELKVGAGKLLVSGYPLSGENIEQQVFRAAVLNYAAGDEFQPKTVVSADWLATILNPQNEDMTDLPAQYSSALLYINCAGAISSGHKPWEKRLDAYFTADGVNYIARSLHSQRLSAKESVWKSYTESRVEIATPAGELGQLILNFNKPTNIAGQIEGRNFFLADTASIALPIDREDCLDGNLTLKLFATPENPLYLEELIFMPKKK